MGLWRGLGVTAINQMATPIFCSHYAFRYPWTMLLPQYPKARMLHDQKICVRFRKSITQLFCWSWSNNDTFSFTRNDKFACEIWTKKFNVSTWISVDILKHNVLYCVLGWQRLDLKFVIRILDPKNCRRGERISGAKRIIWSYNLQPWKLMKLLHVETLLSS